MGQIAMQIQLWTIKGLFYRTFSLMTKKIYSFLLKEVNVATRQEETRLCFQLDVCCLFQKLQQRHRPGPPHL